MSNFEVMQNRVPASLFIIYFDILRFDVPCSIFISLPRIQSVPVIINPVNEIEPQLLS
jgi:hypothetical protein